MTMDRYERLLAAQGFTRVAGADEAGRGALAGPLVAAAVILPDGFDIEGINDSKVLSEAQREAAYERIVVSAAWIACKAEPAAIDARGLHRTNIFLLRRAAKALEPDYVLTDGFPVPRIPCPSIGVKKGDAVSASVAAASIVAKVTRDRIMRRLHRRYPDFGFDHNKGYGTPGSPRGAGTPRPDASCTGCRSRRAPSRRCSRTLGAGAADGGRDGAHAQA